VRVLPELGRREISGKPGLKTVTTAEEAQVSERQASRFGARNSYHRKVVRSEK